MPAIDEVLDRVGDLQLPARRGLDRARGVVDPGREHVHAHERQIGRGLGGLLDQPHDPAHGGIGSLGLGLRKLGDPEVLRVRHRRQQDQRVGLVLAEGLDQVGDPTLQQVVAEVHHERALAEEHLGGQHRVRQPQRLVLHDVGDLHAEPGTISGGFADLLAGLRGDDDPDLLDPRLRHRLDPVEQHRLVGDRHELLGARMRNWAQARALAPGEDQSLEWLHCRRSLPGEQNQ